MPGDNTARSQLEKAKNEAETIGDAAPANFNLDADRGYGYLRWDWLRSPTEFGTPNNFKSETDRREYHAPVAARYGWCDKELNNPGVLQPWDPDPATAAHPVELRYLDREKKTP
jgi:hypothetical protein